MTKDETMKLALEALKELNEENSYWWQEVDESTLKKLISAEKSLEEALSNHIPDDTKMVSGVKDSLTTQQEQGKSFFKFRECEDSQANTTPPSMKCEGPQQRTWVGMTHEECFDIIHTWNRLHKNDWDAAAQMILMVETKLKEKNT